MITAQALIPNHDNQCGRAQRRAACPENTQTQAPLSNKPNLAAMPHQALAKFVFSAMLWDPALMNPDNPMSEYLPPKIDWVREHVEAYEGSGGTKATTLRDTGMPCIIVTHKGGKTGAVRKIPLMRVKVDQRYVLIGSMGGQPKNPVWVYNLRAHPDVEIRDATEVTPMVVREVFDADERAALWQASADAFPPYNDYQAKTDRVIPVFVAEPATQS